MSRKNRVTNAAAANKLRSGRTVWHCQIQENGTVYIHEFLLTGSKLRTVMRSMFPEDVPERKRKIISTSTKIGPKAKDKWTHCYYLSSLVDGWSINTFLTRRAALRWKQEVEAGLHPKAVAQANDHWDMCRSMDDMMRDMDRDYGYDSYDDGPFYGLEDDHEPQTLEGGQPLMQVLKQRGTDGGDSVATYSPEAYVGTDVLPLMVDADEFKEVEYTA